MGKLWYCLILCAALTPLYSCVSFNSADKDTMGLELKKAAIEDKAAIRDMQYKNEKNRHPNHLGLARKLIEKSFYDIALVQLVEAQKTDKKICEVFYLKGVCLKKKKEYKKAIAQFEQAVLANPKYSYAYAGLGMVCDITGDHPRAVKCHTKAVEIDPSVAAFYNNLGVSFIMNDAPKKAVEYLKKCITLNPNSGRAVNNLGLAYGMLGQDDRALGIFQRLDNKAVAYNNMGYVCRISGRREKAIEMYRKAIEVNPEYTAARRNLKEVENEIETSKNMRIESPGL